MSTIQDWPVSQRWIQYKTSQSVKDGYNTRPASQSKVDIIQDWPVSQRWIQYTTGQSIYNEIHIQYRAGQSVHDGYNTDWPVSSRWIQYSLASRSKMVQQIDQPVGLGPVTSWFSWLVQDGQLSRGLAGLRWGTVTERCGKRGESVSGY